MAKAGLVVTIRIAWWVRWYIGGVNLMSNITGLDIDRNKVEPIYSASSHWLRSETHTLQSYVALFQTTYRVATDHGSVSTRVLTIQHFCNRHSIGAGPAQGATRNPALGEPSILAYYVPSQQN